MNKFFLFFGAFLVLCANTVYAEDGLVAHYTFDENYGSILYDSSGNSNDGIIYGAVRVDGIKGLALSFNGIDEYIFLGNDDSLYHNSMTLTEWVSFSETSSSGRMQTINDHSGAGGEWGIGIVLEDTGIVGTSVGGGTNERYLSAKSLSPINDGQWHLVISTYDDSDKRLRLYVDGDLVAINDPNLDRTFTPSDTLTHNSNLYNWFIGKASQSNNFYYNGLIDEVKIYNRALSAEEIKTEYERFTSPTDTDGDGIGDEKELSLGLNPNSPDTDSDGIGDFEEYTLLSTYAPTFQYTPDAHYTEFYPQPVSIFLNYSDIYTFSSSIETNGPFSEEQISVYGPNYFLEFEEEELYGSDQDNIYKRVYDQLQPEYGNTVYMRATTSTYNDESYIVLQYWHHYLYNFFWNQHEGDWEMVEIILETSTQNPLYAAYSQHSDSFYRNGGEIKSWDEVLKEDTHPIVYVALGSHASYFEANNILLLGWVDILSDFTSTLGRTISHEDFNHTIILRDDANPTTQKWLLYEGRWGHVSTNDTDFFGNNGPTGPTQKEEKWNHPAEWGLKYLSRTILLERNIAYLKSGVLTVKDYLSRTVTFRNNEIIREIPKAEVVSIIEKTLYILPGIIQDSSMASLNQNTQGAPATYTYIIEANDTYEFKLYLTNETEAMHIMFYNVSTEPNTKDAVWIKGNKIYMNTTDHTKTLSVMLEYMTGFDEIHVNLTNVRFKGKETLVIEILDWTKLNETGMVLLDTTKKFRFQNRFRTKIISKTNQITEILLKIFGPNDKEVVHWNNRSGKIFSKYSKE